MNIGKNHYQSISKKLLKSNTINEEFQVMLNSLTIEQILSLKLELSAKLVKGKLFGFPIYRSIDYIIKDSLIKFALSSTKSQKEAAAVLGITVGELRNFCRKHEVSKDLE